MPKYTRWTKQELIDAVKNSISMKSCLQKIGLQPTGGNYAGIKSRIVQYNLDTSHWLGQAHNKGKSYSTGRPIEERMVKDGYVQDRKIIKDWLMKNGVNQCFVCGIHDWQDKPLTLQLHHVNGIPTDNRKENLQLLCPNCHSQTENFTGKGRSKFKKYKCKCGNSVSRPGVLCLNCVAENRKQGFYLFKGKVATLLDKVPKDELIETIASSSISAYAHTIGFSKTAVREYCVRKDILDKIYERKKIGSPART